MTRRSELPRERSCLYSSSRRKVSTVLYSVHALSCLCIYKRIHSFTCTGTAQDRINEMEANLNKLLASVDRVFKIEMMKMPQSLHTTLIKDLMNGTAITRPVLIVLLLLFIIFNVFQTMTRLWGRSLWRSR